MKRSIYLAVFFVSMSVLIFEISAVRLFSVLFRYHYVFVVVSFSILGLGIGALLAQIRNQKSRVERQNILAWSAVGFGVGQIGAILLIFFSPLLSRFSPLAAVCVLLLVPFAFAGWFLAQVFSQWPQQAGKLYGADLAGAAVGCVASVGLMNWVGPVNAMLAGAVVAAGVGLILSPRTGFVATIVAGGTLIGNLSSPFAHIEKVSLQLDAATTKPMILKLWIDPEKWRILATEWDAFTRTDVVEGPNPDIRWIFTDGDTPTQMFRADSVASSPEFLKGLIGYVPFHVWRPKEGERMLCIGAGGGLDVQIGHTAGMREIVAVDINRALPRLVEQFKEFHGDVYGKAGTRLIIAEGRNFLARQEQPFDVIYLALTQTATASGTGMALAESYIHTMEAFEDALRHLTPNGRLVIVFEQEASLWRGIETAKRALRLFIPKKADAAEHIIALSETTKEFEPYNHLLVVKRAPLVPTERAAMDKIGRQLGLRMQSASPPPSDVFNLRTVHDDNPFFLDLSFGVPRAVLWLLTVSAAMTLILLGVAFAQGKQSLDPQHPFSIPVLVSLLGGGFMIVQNVAVQRFILFLGYPTLSLSVVIFAMLVGGALGSLFAQHCGDRGQWQRLATVAALILPALVLLNYAAPALTKSWLAFSLAGRITLAMMCLVPLGFLMGIFFPTALRLPNPRMIPLLWTINGTASVAGAALTLSIAKLVNFTLALNVGLICYALAAGLLWRLAVRRSKLSAR